MDRQPVAHGSAALFDFRRALAAKTGDADSGNDAAVNQQDTEWSYVTRSRDCLYPRKVKSRAKQRDGLGDQLQVRCPIIVARLHRDRWNNVQPVAGTPMRYDPNGREPEENVVHGSFAASIPSVVIPSA